MMREREAKLRAYRQTRERKRGRKMKIMRRQIQGGQDSHHLFGERQLRGGTYTVKDKCSALTPHCRQAPVFLSIYFQWLRAVIGNGCGGGGENGLAAAWRGLGGVVVAPRRPVF